MNFAKNIKLLIILLSVLLVSLSGCVDKKPDESKNAIGAGSLSEVKEVYLKDGTRCVIYESYRRGGIVCDWKKAH